MKGVQFFGREDVRFSHLVPEPQIRHPADVLIDVAWCGICGSDLHEYLHGPIFFESNATDAGNNISGKKMPLCLGHEFSGVVKAVGPGVTKVKTGDRVVVEPTGHCRDRVRYSEFLDKERIEEPLCAACKNGMTNICIYNGLCGLGVDNGALADLVTYGEDHVLKIPDNIPLDIAALIQPLAVAWHAVEVAHVVAGSSALILGGGPIGLAVVLALQGHGVNRILVSEPAEVRRKQAASLGCETFDPMTVKAEKIGILREAAPGGEGFDYSFDCSGIPATFKASIEALAPRGTAVNVAIWPKQPIPHYVMDLTYQEKRATGSMCYTMKDFEDVVDALETGKIDLRSVERLITGKILLEHTVEKGLLELVKHKEKHVKILITPKHLELV
ncbi:unnamed protein product [Kuraishia capsulata CBS 1993]|uniref:Enoyl reductase (ER) domain-containing protein n=1 Tax=Kuraishia capsulata CBS 1993 TaxID=1382522 RepID=W6MHP7_9ASCO|nr:uncharacterized protein KUCA_T00001277001 [Kuraishia capsulata CBS 1993]CDK25308.1 unnamed protein product [Kuraishia capsulata CBS 1993]